jgi:hypothetical protein
MTMTGERRPIDKTTLNTGAAVTTTLTRAQSGTLFLIDGTDDIVVNMPALSKSNPGVKYEFLVTTAVASGKTVTFFLAAGGDWYGSIVHYGQSSPCSTDIAGDTLTLLAESAVGSRVSMECVVDNGSQARWMCRAESNKKPTIADA